MPHIRTKHPDGIQTTLSNLTYAVATALNKGMNLQEAQALLAAPTHCDGLIAFSLDESTPSENEQRLRIQIDETVSYRYLSKTTGLPLGLQDTSPVVIDSKNAQDPRFRLKPVWLCLDGQKLCKVRASLLTSNHYLLSLRQQQRILRALLPDLPPHSPFWHHIPPLRLFLTSTAYMHQTTSIHGNLYLFPRVQINLNWVASSNPAAPYGGGPSIHVNGSFLSEQTHPASIDLRPVLLVAVQQELSALHWLQEVAITQPRWQLLVQTSLPNNQRHAVRTLKSTEISDWRQMSTLLPRLAISLFDTPIPHTPSYTPVASPVLTFQHLQASSSVPLLQTFSYENYRTCMHHAAFLIESELTRQNLSC